MKPKMFKRLLILPSRTFYSISQKRMNSKDMLQSKANEKEYDFSKITLNGTKPNWLDKKALVIFKHYKSENEVPNLIPLEKLNKVRNQIRIRGANALMLIFSAVFICTIFYAKSQVSKGHGVQDKYKMKVKTLNEEYLKEQKDLTLNK